MAKVANSGQMAEVAGILAHHERGFDIAQAVIGRKERVLDGQAVAIMPSEEWKDEEVASTYGYPDDYAIGHAVQEAARLREFFPTLDVSHVERLASGLVVPSGWDGIIVRPKCSAVAPVNSRAGWDAFHLAMERLLAIIAEARPDFHDCTEGRVGPEHLRLHWRTLGALAALEARTPGDVLVFPGQTGIIHRGRSIRRARVVLTPREFGLDPFSIGVVVLTHPERLNREGVLWIDCAGAEYAPDAVGQFASAPLWGWHDGKLKFRWHWVSYRFEYCGSASGLLPE